MKVLVVGLGLIGGSIARSLKKHSDYTVFAYDKNDQILSDALDLGVVDSVWKGLSVCDADLTVLCLTPELSVDFLKNNASKLKKNSVVTDVCGIKTFVVSNCEIICEKYGLHFIGGHPMAGKERNGFKNSDENLFNRASYILTKTENTSKKAFDTAEYFVKALNCANLTVTDPETHDRLIAFTSQLPHCIAGAYIKSPSCLNRKGFSAGSFKDVSRVATVDEHLWSELFIKNRDMLLLELDGLIENLSEYRSAIMNQDQGKLKEIIKQGRIIKEKDLHDSEREEKGKFNA